MKEITEEDRQKIGTAMKAIKEEIEKIDWVKLRQEGEELERRIGRRPLSVEDWYRPFTI